MVSLLLREVLTQWKAYFLLGTLAHLGPLIIGGGMLMLILLQANMIDTCGTHPKSIVIVVITNLIMLLLFPTISMMGPRSFVVVADFGVQILLFYLAQ